MLNNIPTILEVDLKAERSWVTQRPDLQNCLGGSGLAAALFAEKVKYEKDSFWPDQPVVMALGPLTAHFPAATKVVAMFRSPLTGELGESHAGMRLGMSLRFAGYDAIVLSGRARRPVYLVVNSQGVNIKAAGPLWGTTVEETGRILREVEGCKGHRSCLRIGTAGEKLIRFANVNVDTYRHFGRLGLGAVFGSKLLKAVVIQGDLKELPIPFPKEYTDIYREIYNKVTETSLMEKYHKLGTSGNVLVLNELRALPTRNLQDSCFEGAEAISGEAFAAHNLLRKQACAGCPVGCIHLALHRKSFGSEQDYEYNQIAYDHELLYSLGSLLGIASREDILSLIQAVELAGLDAISTGVALAWATEAFDKGMISEAQLGCKPEFGQVQPYLSMINSLVEQDNPFYCTLAQGTEEAANVYGGRNFSLTLGRNEVAGYHTGYANLVGQAVGARHSHLDNAGYSFDQERENLALDKLAGKILLEEIERLVLTSLCICLFARKVYDFALVERALHALGLNWGQKDLYRLGRDTCLLKREIKEKLGFRQDKVRFPRRFFETPSLNGMLEPWQASKLQDKYLHKLEQLNEGSFPWPIDV